MSLSGDHTLLRKDGVVRRDVAGETFLVPIRGHLADLQELFVLNEVGRWIWDHLDGRRSITDLAAGVAGEFEVDEATALRDLHAFVQSLLEAGLADGSQTAEKD